MPAIAGTRRWAAQAVGISLTELKAPFSDRRRRSGTRSHLQMESVGVSTPWSINDSSPLFLCSWRCGRMFENFTFSPILYHPLQFAIRSVVFFLDTNWPQPYGVNPSVETVRNWHTCRAINLLLKLALLLQNLVGWRSGGELCWRATRQGIASWRLIVTDGRGSGLRVAPCFWIWASPMNSHHRDDSPPHA